MISTLLTWLLVGIGGLVVISIALSIIGGILGLAFGLVGFLLFKVVPVLLVGYVLVRLLAPRRTRLASGDQDWLEGA